MDTTAVSVTDLVIRRHNNKWKDYHFLKHLIRQAYLSENGCYETEASSLRLSMFRTRSVCLHVLSLHTFYSEEKGKHLITCYIK